MLRNKPLASACSIILGTASLAFASSAFAAAPVVLNSIAGSSTLTINGSNLSGGTATVTLGGSAALPVQSQTATQLVVALPGGLAAGTYALSVQIGSSKTNATSSAATIGAVGPAGPSGPVGPQGPAGQTGSTGAPGPQGVQGDQGPVGPVGPTGTQGAKGDVGATGATGAQGAQGAMGPQGPKGETGERGPQGVAGATGPAGPPGPQGLQGPMGPPGGPALSLLDATGLAVGSLYGGGYQSGDGLFLARINGERVVIPFGWGNIDPNTGFVLGPEVNIGTTGILVYGSTDCSGQAYILEGWGPAPGGTKPSALYQSGGQYTIYIPSTAISQSVNYQSWYYPGPSFSTNPEEPYCSTDVWPPGGAAVVPVDTSPITLNWSYPFSLQ